MRNDFGKRFSLIDRVNVHPGRVLQLNCHGPGGCLSLIVAHIPPQLLAEETRLFVTKCQTSMMPPRKALTVVMGDWNCTVASEGHHRLHSNTTTYETSILRTALNHWVDKFTEIQQYEFTWHGNRIFNEVSEVVLARLDRIYISTDPICAPDMQPCIAAVHPPLKPDMQTLTDSGFSDHSPRVCSFNPKQKARRACTRLPNWIPKHLAFQMTLDNLITEKWLCGWIC